MHEVSASTRTTRRGHFLSACIGAAAVLAACWPTPRAIAQTSAPGAAKPAAGSGITGKVVETMDSGGYTYLLVDDGSRKVWAAAPQFKVAVGDRVVVPEGMAMRDFNSKTLGRTFQVVYFVSGVQVAGGHAADEKVAAAHGAPAAGAATAVDLSNIEKADGGYTVAELFANKVALAGKDVVVRGRVVKFTPAVMGKNWIHLRDGTGGAGANDLTVSTDAAAAVGKTILVRGKLSTKKDFGFGYRYEVIIEDAVVTVE